MLFYTFGAKCTFFVIHFGARAQNDSIRRAWLLAVGGESARIELAREQDSISALTSSTMGLGLGAHPVNNPAANVASKLPAMVCRTHLCC